LPSSLRLEDDIIMFSCGQWLFTWQNIVKKWNKKWVLWNQLSRI
jgi:hypothetical protein